MSGIALQQLRSNAALKSALASGCDFDVDDGTDPGALEITGPGGAVAYDVIGMDGTGSVFVQIAPDLHVAYVSSEGQAGMIAASLADALTLLVFCPQWHDVLKFSGGGDLAVMRRADAAFRDSVDEDGADERETVKKILQLAPPADAVAHLHQAVSVLGANITVAGPGGAMQSLFGKGTK